MNRSQRLQPIQKLADNKEKVAAQVLGKSVEHRQGQLDKLSQLNCYRAEYVESMTKKTLQGMSGDQLQQYHQFLNKIDTAIEQQKSAVEQSAVDLSLSQNEWQSNNSRASAITKVVKNLKADELKERNKRETIQVDEMSTQAFLRSKICQ